MKQRYKLGFAIVLTLALAAGCSSPLTTGSRRAHRRRRGAGTGAIIGSAVGHAAVGRDWRAGWACGGVDR
jgi:hypothetical protein